MDNEPRRTDDQIMSEFMIERANERAAFVKDIETHLADIVKDAGKVGKTFEDWNNQLERKQIDGDAIKSRLCDVSNLLDDIYNELRGL